MILLSLFGILAAFWILGAWINAIADVFRAAPWRGWKWSRKGMVWALPPFLLIALVEIISPSTKLTGYSRPGEVSAGWQLQTRPFENSPETWAEFSHIFLGADTQGGITRDRAEAMLTDFIAGVEQEIEDAEETSPSLSRTVSTFIRNLKAGAIEKHRRRIEVLHAALNDLDALYRPSVIVTPQALQYHIGLHVERFVSEPHEDLLKRIEDAESAVTQWETDNPDALMSDPERLSLREKLGDLRGSEAKAGREMSGAMEQLQYLQERMAYATPDRLFVAPQYMPEIWTSDGRNSLPIDSFDGSIVRGPETTTGFRETLARVWKAFDVTMRLPERVPLSMRCYPEVTESGQGGRACEMHLPIHILYDLTAGDCASDCVESWAMPDLTILLRDDSVTFLPPVSRNPASVPISQWEVTYNGINRVLEPAGTIFKRLESDSAPRPEFTLRHAPMTGQQTVRIWNSFEAASFLRDEGSLRQDPTWVAYNFEGQDIKDVAVRANRFSWMLEVVEQRTNDLGHRQARTNFVRPYLEALARRSDCFSHHRERLRMRALNAEAQRIYDLIAEQVPQDAGQSYCARVNSHVMLLEGLWPVDPTGVLKE